MTRIPVALPLACLAAVALAACSGADRAGARLPATDSAGAEGGVPAADSAATVFLVQTAPPEAMMEALYEGRVVRDERGCLRTEGDSPATVVWPFGFTLEESGADLRVKDASGRVLGRIGERFRFGGGQVPSNGYGFLPEPARTTAATRCPGDVWIVGDTSLRS